MDNTDRYSDNRETQNSRLRSGPMYQRRGIGNYRDVPYEVRSEKPQDLGMGRHDQYSTKKGSILRIPIMDLRSFIYILGKNIDLMRYADILERNISTMGISVSKFYLERSDPITSIQSKTKEMKVPFIVTIGKQNERNGSLSLSVIQDDGVGYDIYRSLDVSDALGVILTRVILSTPDLVDPLLGSLSAMMFHTRVSPGVQQNTFVETAHPPPSNLNAGPPPQPQPQNPLNSGQLLKMLEQLQQGHPLQTAPQLIHNQPVAAPTHFVQAQGEQSEAQPQVYVQNQTQDMQQRQQQQVQKQVPPPNVAQQQEQQTALSSEQMKQIANIIALQLRTQPNMPAMAGSSSESAKPVAPNSAQNLGGQQFGGSFVPSSSGNSVYPSGGGNQERSSGQFPPQIGQTYQTLIQAITGDMGSRGNDASNEGSPGGDGEPNKSQKLQSLMSKIGLFQKNREEMARTQSAQNVSQLRQYSNHTEKAPIVQNQEQQAQRSYDQIKNPWT